MPPTRTATNGAALRVIRERTGLTVREVVAALADLGVRVHEDHLRNLETGARQGAGPALIAGLAKVLQIPQTAITSPLATEREAAHVGR